MRKNVFICIFIGFFIADAAWTEQNGSPHNLSLGIQLDMTRDRNMNGAFQTLIYEFTEPTVSASTGLKIGYEGVSVTADGSWMPVRIRLFSFGPQIGYNFSFFTEYCIEHNFIFGSKLSFGKIDTILLTAECSYLLKLTDFYRLNNAVPLLVDNSVALSLSLYSKLFNRLLIGFKIYSYGMFDYPLFCSPSYELQLGWLISPHFTIESSVIVRYSDMFTLTSYLSDIMVCASLRYTIPQQGN